MPNQYIEQFRKLADSLSLRQKLTIGAATIAVAAMLAYFLYWNKEKDFKPLFTNVSGEDAGQVLTKLRESSVEFRLTDGGTTIRVPSNKLDELRIQMASAGLPKTGRIGYELFDKTSFGSSEFAEQVNYHRAIEGELERSIMSISEVESARVHITFPKQSIFLENRQPAKASVLVKLKPGSRLAQPNVAAIMRLTGNAVDGLSPDDVAVLDMRGNLLNPGRKLDADSEAGSEAFLSYRQKIESALLQKIQLALDPVLGADRFRASVAVECDFSSGEQSEETFDPSKSTMTSSQKTEDVGALASVAGVPGTASNLPRPTARPANGGANQQRRTENIVYQTSRIVRRMKLPQGTVRRVSVSVLVDHNVRFDGTGDKAKRIVEAPSPERLKAVKDFVSAAVGLTTERGDQLIVEAIPFESTLAGQPPPEPKIDPSAPKVTLPNWVPSWMKSQWEEQIASLLMAKYFTLLVVLFALIAIAIPLLILRWIGRKLGTAVAAVTSKVSRKKGKAEAKLEEQDKQISSTEQQHPVAELTAAPSEAGASLANALPAAAGSAIGINREQVLKDYEQSLTDADELKRRLTEDAVSMLKKPDITTQRGEILAKHLSQETKKYPEAMAQMVRTWIHEN